MTLPCETSHKRGPVANIDQDSLRSGPTLCVEGVGTGCTVTFNVLATNGTLLNLTLATDEEAFFDPFKAGFDTSDGFKVSVPEPGSLALLTCGGWVEGKRHTP